MPTFTRTLQITLPRSQSAFLWGPRKTGKSTYLKQAFPQSLRFDLLQTDLFMDLARNPALLRQRLLARPPEDLARPVLIDEVQKIPALMDEVHGLIESRGLSFILCGSSARKLKRGRANLLGGRAWRYEMHPLVWPEIGDFDLLRALNRGLVPSHYLSADPARSVDAYIQDYLKEEIMEEGLIRNIPAFSRFLDAVGFSNGQLINYSNIARDCGVDSKTVKEYFQILVDTLLGSIVEPYKRRQERQVITKASKFYLFDVGIAGGIRKRRILEARGEDFGNALEHFILMELTAHSAYSGLRYDIQFWRTKTGMEVDFILDRGQIAIEVKGTSRVDSRDLRSIRAFTEEHRPRHSYVVANETEARMVDGIRVLPWAEFLQLLWSGQILR